jgi:hypothetical protein
MAIAFFDGFDRYATLADLGIVYPLADGNFSATSGRFGGGGWSCSGGGAQLVRLEPGGVGEAWYGFAFNFATGGGGGDQILAKILQVSSVTAELLITFNGSTGFFKAIVHNGATLATSSPAISVAGWHWLDIHVKISPTVGLVEIWADNIQIINITGVNTSASGGSLVGGIALGSENSDTGHTPSGTTYDDLAVINVNGLGANNSRLGDCRIQTRVAASDAGPNNGTPSTAGAHYLMVNEPQWSPTNTVTLSNVTGQEEAYGITPLLVNTGTIYAVQPVFWAEKSDAGAATIELSVRSGASTASGPPTALTTTYAVFASIVENNPNGNIPWTAATVNACAIGLTVQ